MSLALLWALSLMGMQSFSPPLDGVADCAAMLSVLIAAGQSSGMGCLAGVVAGAVLSLSGGDYFFGAALSPVSYTHLDVYKRQTVSLPWTRTAWITM